MGDSLHVDPLDLHHSGKRTAELHQDSRQTFSRAHAEASDAVAAGWVGSSAEAMSAYLEDSRAAAAQITAQLSAHATHFHSAASGYTTTDEKNGATVRHAGSSLNLSA